ncbi:MAG: ABC transporter permease [Spirochaetales bacterium]
MSLSASLLLAVRFLFGADRTRRVSRRMRGGIIGVGLSLIPLVVVLQVADGMIAGITERFIEAGSYHVQAIAREELGARDLSRSADAVSGLSGVTLVTRERRGLGLAAVGTERTAVTIRAVEPDLWASDPALNELLEFREGEWRLDPDGILLGEYVARELGARVGDEVRILTARSLSGGRVLPRTRSFTVRGILSSGYADLDRLWVFLPYEQGARMLPEQTSELLLGVKIDDPLAISNPLFRPPSRDAASRAARLVDAIRIELGPRFRVATWFESERAKYMSFKTTKDLLVFIMVLIVIVAAVNISSTLVMLVLEKQEEIAVIKSYGASPGGVVRAFVVAGFVLGAMGAFVGIAVGLLFAVNINEILAAVEWTINAGVWTVDAIAGLFSPVDLAPIELLSGEYYLQEIPITIRYPDLLLVTCLTLLLATVAAWFPARRAGRIRPLEVLRKH